MTFWISGDPESFYRPPDKGGYKGRGVGFGTLGKRGESIGNHRGKDWGYTPPLEDKNPLRIPNMIFSIIEKIDV